jgi:hypothetical protein
MEEFWNIVQGSRRGDRPAQLEALRAELRRRTPEEVVQFQRRFEREMERANTWDLWGAAYVLNGGCSDDAFEYFRSWLIAQGREAFERALADPDCLADLPAAAAAAADDEGVFFEEYAYVAGKVHEEKTGKSIPGGGEETGAEPRGTSWSESGDDLKNRFPRLWAKFGGRTGGGGRAEPAPAGKKGCLLLAILMAIALAAAGLGVAG